MIDIAQHADGTLRLSYYGRPLAHHRFAFEDAVPHRQPTATTEEQCAPKSQFEMYAAYEAGRGVKKDLGVATKWLIRSAESGLPRAQYALGNAYQRGYGVEKDVDLARTWIRKSREGVSYHDDHDHSQPSFAGPELAKRFSPFTREQGKP